ncbi:MAG: hypothetical protein KF909_09785 [Rhodocyclaceae bacterium]|nr:hypothetical protein [Rhodocyclaceae bacterium]MCW5613992.1 hypothetical protein [Rhodocyclaceae bacterium]
MQIGEDQDNIIWRALSGGRAPIVSGTGEVRRYAPGFPPLLGFVDCERPSRGAHRVLLQTRRTAVLRRLVRRCAGGLAYRG